MFYAKIFKYSATFKGTHARDFIVHFSKFLASFNNRQGGGSEFVKIFKIELKIPLNNRIFANTALSPKTQQFTPRFWQKFSENE
jgi:hypothetical protein